MRVTLKFLSFVGIVFLASCAQITTLDGGERDEYAPKVDVQKSIPQNGAINYNGNSIILSFDEYFQLKDAQNNISINPSLGKLKIEKERKEVHITWEETLLPNTTYNLLIDGAITDLNEQNDSIYQWVFSTGSLIDEGVLNGMAQEAYTGQKLGSLTIQLLQNNIVQYATKSNNQGDFEFSYLKNGNYQLFAFKDDNKNRIYDSTEIVGFNPSVQIGVDSVVNLKVFRPLKKEKFNVQIVNNGQAIISGKKDVVSKTLINGNQAQIAYVFSQDSVLVNYPSSDVLLFTNNLDTVKKALNKNKSRLEIQSLNLTKLKAKSNIYFSCDYGIVDFQKAYFLHENGSKYSASSLKEEVLQFTIPDVSGKIKLILDQGFLNNGSQLSDSLKFDFQVFQEKDLSELVLLFDSTETDYHIELYQGKMKIASQGKTKTQTKVTFSGLIPEDIRIVCIRDENGNGAWDTGNLSEQIQAEKVSIFSLSQKLRGNWSIEQRIQLEN